MSCLHPSGRIYAWPDALPEIDASAEDVIERWTTPRTEVLQGNRWVDQEEAEELADDEYDWRPRRTSGCHVVWGEYVYLEDARGVRRTAGLRGSAESSNHLLMGALVAEALGDGAPVSLRAAVTLAFELGLMTWEGDRTARASRE